MGVAIVFVTLFLQEEGTKMNNSARALSRLMIGQTRAFRTSAKKLAEVDGAVSPRYYAFKENQKILAEIGHGKPIHEKRGVFAKNCMFALNVLAGVNVIAIVQFVWKLH